MGAKGFFGKILSGSNAIGSIWICFLMLLITVDVGGRVFFNSPMVGTPEIVSNSLVAIAFLQIAFVLMEDRHVRATVLYDKFSPKGRTILDIITYTFGLILFAAVMFSSWKLFLTAVSVGEFEGEGALRVPTSPVRFIILLGSLMMLIQYILQIVHRIKQLGCKVEKA